MYYIFTRGRDLFALSIYTCVLLPRRMEEKYVCHRVIAFSFGGKKKNGGKKTLVYRSDGLGWSREIKITLELHGLIVSCFW